MNQIIVATHTTLATGFEAFVKFFMPDVANLHIINAYVDTPEFENQLRGVLDTLPAEDRVIVLTDIAGGSVNQKAALLIGRVRFQARRRHQRLVVVGARVPDGPHLR